MNKILLPIIAFISLTSCGDDKESQRGDRIDAEKVHAELLLKEDSSPFRGYAAINEDIKFRMVANEDFDIGLYLQPKLIGFQKIFPGQSLAVILGSSKGTGTQTIKNGQEPTAMNMMLWQMVIEGFAAELAMHCKNEFPEEHELVAKELHEDFEQPLEELCQEELMDADQLTPLYEALLSYEGASEHFETWSDFNFQYKAHEENETPEQNTVFTALFSAEYLVRR